MTLWDTTHVDAPPARVFAFFEHMDAHYVDWHPDHHAFRWLDGGGVAEGDRFEFSETIGGRRMDKTLVFTEVVPDRLVAFAPANGLVRLLMPRLSFAMAPEGAGARLTAEIIVRTGPVGAWLNRREFDAVRRHMREEGEGLRRIVEAEAGGRFVPA